MTRNLIRSALLWVPVVLLAFSAPAQSNMNYGELPNFQMVSERFYRGAQPKDGGFRRLAELGIKTVINLRETDRRAQRDRLKAEAAGLRFFNIPMAGHARPTDKQVTQVLSIINAPENQPVFIYCKRGADRTGTITAIYRISQEGWTSESAIAEANRRGMFPTQFEMKDYIRDYYCRQQQATGDNKTCGDRRLVDQLGTPAAVFTRRMIEEISRHAFTRKSVRQMKKLFR